MKNTMTVTAKEFRNRVRFDGWRVLEQISENVYKVKISRTTYIVTVQD
jgi:hypothetical protein